MWLTGQIGSIKASLWLTIERFYQNHLRTSGHPPFTHVVFGRGCSDPALGKDLLIYNQYLLYSYSADQRHSAFVRNEYCVVFMGDGSTLRNRSLVHKDLHFSDENKRASGN